MKYSCLAASIFSFLFGYALLGHAQDTQARAKEEFQTMVYSVYAGGIHAVEAELMLQDDHPERYRMALHAKTRGFLAKLAPWSGTFETEGWREEGELQPELHRSTSTWREDTQVKEYTYTKEGGFVGLSIVEEGVDKTPDNINEELTENTTDSLTAALLVMQSVREKGACEGRSEVFDGKRRFELVFRNKGERTLSKSRYNLYSGPAVLCEVEVEPKGGEWHKRPRGWLSIQEQGRKRDYLPKLWLAHVEEDGPAVPVKIMVKTDYGALMAHLTDYDGEADFEE